MGGALAIRHAAYAKAVDEAYWANQGAAESYVMFTGHLQGYGSMSGSDDLGAQFAADYDKAAADAVEAYAALVSGFGALAHLSEASQRNHRAANQASTIDSTFTAGSDHPAEHEVVRVDTVVPPSAEGGDGAGPDWWHWIGDKVGTLYPDADTDRLRQAGSRWHQEADQVESFAQYMLWARDGFAAQSSPEASLAQATCMQVCDYIKVLGETFRGLGDACTGFADDIDEHRDQMEHELASFIGWTIGLQAFSHGLAFFTLGGSELVGQSAQAIKIAKAVATVKRILSELAVVAALRFAPLAKTATAVRAVTVQLQPLITASTRMAKVRALGVAGEKAAKITKNTRRIDSATRPGRYRIPDQLDDAARVIGEVKNVKTQGLTSQLRDFLTYAENNPGWTFVLYVRPSTTLTGPLQALVDAGKIVLRRTL